ncbi:hypothetical protein RCH18_001724 [Flavobacterium sp. PL11]|nr:hypothetical protein [Flavobacterium sp. PL11]
MSFHYIKTLEVTAIHFYFVSLHKNTRSDGDTVLFRFTT